MAMAAGTPCATFVGKVMDGQALRLLFTIVMAVIPWLMSRPRTVTLADVPVLTRRLYVNVALVALATAASSGLFSIGGGCGERLCLGVRRNALNRIFVTVVLSSYVLARSASALLGYGE